ncbi:MAG: hypothetical protein RBT78_09765, partial [Kiritimatiellia bacterium]|nr:hypothetical protein [Kiritimatiellia bacterium]
MGQHLTMPFPRNPRLTRARQQFFYEKASQGHPHGGIPFFRNAVDVSLLSALLMDNMLSGA